MAAPAIGLRPRFTPPRGARVDMTHPIATGLVMLALPIGKTFLDVLTDTKFSIQTGNPYPSPHALGDGLTYGAVVANGGWSHPNTALLPTGECTIALIYRKHDSTARASAAFGVINASTTARAGAHLPYSDGIVYLDYGGNTTGNGRTTASGLTFQDHDVWVFTSIPSGPTGIWQSGILRGSTTNAGRSRRGSNVWYIGNANGAALGSTDICTISFAAIWNRALPAGQIAEFSANPYSLLRY